MGSSHMHSDLSVSELMEDLADVSDWYHLGMALGLKSTQLDTIEQEIPLGVGSVVRRKSRVLDTWMRGRTDSPSLRDVVTALHQIKEDRVADKMREKYSGGVATEGEEKKIVPVVGQAAIAMTRAHVKVLKNKWAKLLRTVCRKLSQENKVDIEDVHLYICAQISIVLPDMCSSTFYKIFLVLQENKLLDFWNCDLLWNIVNEYLPHDEELPQPMEEYQSELEHFKRSTKVINFIAIIDSELSPDVSDFDAPRIQRKDHYQPYTFEMDADPREATLMDIERSWKAQINQYSLPDLQKGLLQWIAPSSILVTYLIPAKMALVVVERVQTCVSKFFTQQRILSITVGEERVYSGANFPVELRKIALGQLNKPMSETESLRTDVQRMSVEPTHQASSQSPTGLSPCTRLQWRRGADAPEEIIETLAVVMGEKVYVEGWSEKVHQYDWRRDTWSTLPDCPVSDFGMSQFLGMLITVGGWDMQLSVTGKVYQFNGQQWEEFLQPMPTARSRPTVATRSSSSPKPPVMVACEGFDANIQPLNTVEVYSHASSQWHTAKPLPIPCSSMTSVTINDTCYLLGGKDSTSSGTKCCFSVSLDSLINIISPHSQLDDPIWMSVSDTPLIQSTAASLKGSLIAIGGVDDSTRTTSSAVHVLTSDGSWERVRGGDLPEPRWGVAAVCLPSGELLIAGGTFDFLRVPTRRTVFIASIVDSGE